MTYFKLLLCACIVIAGTNAFFMDDPCDIYPQYQQPGIPKDPNNMITDTVPANCHNGTVDWNYPKGHLMLHFPNPAGTPTSVCLRDRLGGDVFVITDVTDSAHRTLGDFVADHYSCTTTSRSTEIVLKIDAPADQRYMGAVKYLVKRHA